MSITAIIATKDEAKNIGRCLEALTFAERVVVVDSQSADETVQIARQHNAEILQFTYGGGYPKKRQWALDTLRISTPWVLLLDADEVVTPALAKEIEAAVQASDFDAYYIRKGFHFLGYRFRFGGFSHSAVLLFRTGCAKFERLFEDHESGLDMEVHERLIVQGRIGSLGQPLVHEDFKGLAAYIDRHNKYSTWEAQLRRNYLISGQYGELAIPAQISRDVQRRRRFLKKIAMRLPLEPQLWFLYHYVFRLGLLEGRPGLIASQLRASYISQVRAKMYECRLREDADRRGRELDP